MPTIEISEEEQEALLKMRESRNDSMVVSDDDPPLMYLRLLAAKAELYIMALRLGDNNPMTRYESFHRMVSPHDVIKLVRAFIRLRDLEEEIADGAEDAA